MVYGRPCVRLALYRAALRGSSTDLEDVRSCQNRESPLWVTWYMLSVLVPPAGARRRAS
jgi:hypothetical protein